MGLSFRYTRRSEFFIGLSFRDTRRSEFFVGLGFRDTRRRSEFFVGLNITRSLIGASANKFHAFYWFSVTKEKQCGALARRLLDTIFTMSVISTVTVFCGSRDGVDPRYAEAARGRYQALLSNNFPPF